MSAGVFDEVSARRIMEATLEVEARLKSKQKPDRRFRPLGASGGTALFVATTEIGGASWDGTVLTPGNGQALRLVRQNGTWSSAGQTAQTILNSVPDESVAVGKPLQAKKINGAWFVDVEPCEDEPPGMASAAQSTPQGYPTIGGAWTPLDTMDTETFPSQRITFDTTDSTWIFDDAGVWDVELTFNMTHGESNQGRTTNLRIFDITEGVAVGPEAPIPIARNQPGTLFNATLRVVIDEAGQGQFDVGDEFQMQIGNGDTISGVTMNLLRLALTQIYEKPV